MKYYDLHRHDERSAFDGFGNIVDIVKVAKELEYPSLGISNHGDMSSLVTHYYTCKEAGIKPIMGNEVYFQPKFKEVRKSYHLCLFVKNLKGYQNLNKIITKAENEQFYYKGIVDFALLEKYSEGLICSSACMGGILSKCLLDDEEEKAIKYAKKFVEIFGDDFYIEIQPYKVDMNGTQEIINKRLMKLARKLKIKCIPTSDSHFCTKEDFDTYTKMHEMGGHGHMAENYKERYMPSESQIIKRFNKLHSESKISIESMIDNLTTLSDSVEEEILEKLTLELPVFDKKIDSKKLLMQEIKDGLKKRGLYNEKYLKRCQKEYKVITHHGFEDYFLIVQDYVRWAKEHDIAVGHGRGSVCNCLIAFALGITEVDSIFFNLDFSRFLRMDKKKLPKQYWAYSVNCANRCVA